MDSPLEAFGGKRVFEMNEVRHRGFNLSAF